MGIFKKSMSSFIISHSIGNLRSLHISAILMPASKDNFLLQFTGTLLTARNNVSFYVCEQESKRCVRCNEKKLLNDGVYYAHKVAPSRAVSHIFGYESLEAGLSPPRPLLNATHELMSKV